MSDTQLDTRSAAAMRAIAISTAATCQCRRGRRTWRAVVAALLSDDDVVNGNVAEHARSSNCHEHNLRPAAINVTPHQLHAHPFNGLCSWTTCESRYQKGKTGLDLNEARDDGVLWMQWHQQDTIRYEMLF